MTVSFVQMFQIQDRICLNNGKPNIVLKTTKRFNIIRTRIIIFIFLISFKLWIVVLVHVYLTIGYSFYYWLLLWIWAGISNPQSFNLCPFLTFSVINGPSFSISVMYWFAISLIVTIAITTLAIKILTIKKLQ